MFDSLEEKVAALEQRIAQLENLILVDVHITSSESDWATACEFLWELEHGGSSDSKLPNRMPISVHSSILAAYKEKLDSAGISYTV